eukprot:TRINITY_DN2217_c0_g1_i1.p2 TRINITY_DN2217_c0_g1~~TRINITY_DN2217_c0_g1_i1.p2  ORF type:complete len:440 (+),score=157.78 TRINITY_DN2217_c0_g1_i1:88-1407(+)
MARLLGRPEYFVDRSAHPSSVWRCSLVYPDLALTLDVRPMDPDDEVRESEFFEAQTMGERYKRFFVAKHKLTKQELRNFTHVDYSRKSFALVAVDTATDELAGVGRFAPDDAKGEAVEMAVAVLKRFQGMGIGGFLVRELFRAAHAQHVKVIVAHFLLDNHDSMRLFDRAAARCSARLLERGAVTGGCDDIDDGEVTRRWLLPADFPPRDEHSAEAARAAQQRQREYTIDFSRHPKGLWRHDLRYTHSGMDIAVRPLSPDDEAREKLFYDALAEDERRLLLFYDGDDPDTPVLRRRSSGVLRRMAHVDYAHDFALVAVDRPTDSIVAMARYRREAPKEPGQPPGMRLMCVTLMRYRGMNLSRFLCAQLCRHAARDGLRWAQAAVPSQKLEPFRGLLAHVAADIGGALRDVEGADGPHAEIELPQQPVLLQSPAPSPAHL